MFISIWQALNPFNGGNYELDGVQRLAELRCVIALLVIFAVALALSLILRLKKKKKNGETKNGSDQESGN